LHPAGTGASEVPAFDLSQDRQGTLGLDVLPTLLALADEVIE